jgi:hypothetical protein
MAVARSRYRVNKRKHAPKRPKRSTTWLAVSLVAMLNSNRRPTLTAPKSPSPQCGIAGHGKRCRVSLYLAVADLSLPRFCQKVFEETDHFATADPVEACKSHMHYEVARSFLEFSCEEGKFGSASSLFTFAKTWRMGVHLHTRHPVDQTVKMDMKNVRSRLR